MFQKVITHMKHKLAKERITHIPTILIQPCAKKTQLICMLLRVFPQ